MGFRLFPRSGVGFTHTLRAWALIRATRRTPSSCLTLLLFSRSTFWIVYQVKVFLNSSEWGKRTAASTWACKARLVSLSIVPAISPETWSVTGHGRISRRLTLELPIDDGKVLESDTIFERGGVQVIHGVSPQRVKELRRALHIPDGVAVDQGALLDHRAIVNYNRRQDFRQPEKGNSYDEQQSVSRWIGSCPEAHRRASHTHGSRA
jgi:hypothetical protein